VLFNGAFTVIMNCESSAERGCCHSNIIYLTRKHTVFISLHLFTGQNTAAIAVRVIRTAGSIATHAICHLYVKSFPFLNPR
jgi:hypothetical protein